MDELLASIQIQKIVNKAGTKERIRASSITKTPACTIRVMANNIFKNLALNKLLFIYTIRG